MTTIAHFLAATLYLAAAVLAAAPFVRRMAAPVRGVTTLVALGVAAHVGGLIGLGWQAGQLQVTGLGPALSFAGLAVAATLLIVEVLAREVSLTLLAAPLAALTTIGANLIGLTPGIEPEGA